MSQISQRSVHCTECNRKFSGRCKKSVDLLIKLHMNKQHNILDLSNMITFTKDKRKVINFISDSEYDNITNNLYIIK